LESKNGWLNNYDEKNGDAMRRIAIVTGQKSFSNQADSTTKGRALLHLDADTGSRNAGAGQRSRVTPQDPHVRHMSLSLYNCAEKLAGEGCVRYQAADSCPPTGRNQRRKQNA
jgi:hypothetical protein